MAEISLLDLTGMLVGLVLTLCVFSYLIGDNPLFRLALHIFIGVSAGFAFVAALKSVLLPKLVFSLLTGSNEERLLALFPLLFSLLLCTRIFPRFSSLGLPVMAYLVGVGAATAIGGAVLGTIFPQVGAAVNRFDLLAISASGKNVLVELLNAFIFLFGTLMTLGYFYFGTRFQNNRSYQGWIRRVIAWFGQGFIAIVFGAVFAGVYAAALTALIERMNFMANFLKLLLFSA